MPAILNELTQRINEHVLRELSQQIGADELKTKKATTAALPLLIGALARNANRSRSDAEALTTALDRDHDGSLLDELLTVLHLATEGSNVSDASSGLPGGISIDRRSVDGNGILEHLLGDRRDAVQSGISKASNLDVHQVSRLMAVLAPMVMSALGKVKRERNLDPDTTASLLNRERAEIEREATNFSSGELLEYLEGDDNGSLIERVKQLSSRFAVDQVVDKIFGNNR